MNSYRPGGFRERQRQSIGSQRPLHSRFSNWNRRPLEVGHLDYVSVLIISATQNSSFKVRVHAKPSRIPWHVFQKFIYFNLFVSIPGPKVIKLFFMLSSAQLSLKFILLINVKMPTIVGILTFMSRINYRLWGSKPSISIYLGYFSIYDQFKFYAHLS